jgi:hypothetical protein
MLRRYTNSKYALIKVENIGMYRDLAWVKN